MDRQLIKVIFTFISTIRVGADSDFKKSIEMEPENDISWGKYISIHFKISNIQLIILVINSLQTNNITITIIEGLGIVHSKQSRFEDAKQCYDNALKFYKSHFESPSDSKQKSVPVLQDRIAGNLSYPYPIRILGR